MRLAANFSVITAMFCAGVAVTTHAQPVEGVEASGTATTRLYVKTIPPGAQVTLDGKPLGPSDGLFIVPAGAARVSVQFDGQGPQVQQVEIAEGRITRIEIQRGAADDLVSGVIDTTIANLGGAKPMAGMAGGPMAGMGSPIAGYPIVVAAGLGLTSSRKLETPPAPLTKFDDILEKPLDFEAHDTPLQDVARLIGEKAGLPISFDRKAFEEAGFDPETPVTASASGLSLARGLDIVCRPLDLAWTVEEDGIRITTVERSQEDLIRHIYEVSDLTEKDFQTLIMIVQSIEPNSWNTVGGIGSIEPDASDAGTFLVVSQPLAVQRQISGMLDCLRRLKAMPPEQRSPLASDGYWSAAEPAARVRKALEAPYVDAAFNEIPLSDALRQMSKKAGVPLAVDFRACDNAGFDLDTPVTIASTTLPLARLLDRLLSPLGLTYVIADDRLTVTTKDKAAEILSVAVYPVHRLVGTSKKSRSFGSLINLIHSTVEPSTWNSVGGIGSIEPVGGDVPCLVIGQTTAGHRAVDAFLRSLR